MLRRTRWKPVREFSRERVVTLMTLTEKTRLESKAKDAGISIGELIRRAVDAFDAEEMRQLEQIAAVAREFRIAADRASRSLDRTNAKVEETLKALASRHSA